MMYSMRWMKKVNFRILESCDLQGEDLVNWRVFVFVVLLFFV